MIPQKHSGGVEIDGLTGERSRFTIAANGKAFRTLIDGLYSNKIQAVTRELWSNAADSHVAAGCPTRPFKASVPTSMDPTFRVRDYGTGLSHEGVMRLYTTIFESTKEDTNDQTGMLGLGSKSPFAYTDTFSVIAYDGSTKRVYVANIGSDGVPSITFVSSSASSEERGLEVSFPVQRGDVRTFHAEAQWVSMGFAVKPDIDGMELKFPTPRMSGTNWAIYPPGAFGDGVRSRNLIRQGFACYPNDGFAVPGLGTEWITIVDVPIGTCDVTASREALSYTQETRTKVKALVEKVGSEIMDQIRAEVAKAVTRRQVAKVYYEFNGVLNNLRGGTMVSLMADSTKSAIVYPGSYNGSPSVRRPGDVVTIGPNWGRSVLNTRRNYRTLHTSYCEVHLLDQIRLFVDYGEKMVRKTQRIRAYAYRPNDYVVAAEYDDNGKEVAVSWIIECWELKPNQIFKVSDAPDPGPPQKFTVPPTKKSLKPGQYWMIRKNGCTETVYGTGSTKDDGEGWPRALRTARNHLLPCALSEVRVLDSMLYVTPLQATKLGLDEAFRFDTAVEAELIRQVKAAPIDDALAVIELNENLEGEPYAVIREQFFSHLKLNSGEARTLIEKAKYARIDLQNRQITASVKSQIRLLASTYPLMFGRTDKRVFEQYIQQVKLANKAEEVKQPA